VRSSLATVVILLACTSPLRAQRNLTEIPDPDPELERQSFQVTEGFEVNLFAADPVLAKPIQMNFDSQGRLWVVSSEVYPQISPGQVANDKVIVLEDKDGDGRAEKTTIFADGLLIPTGIEPGDGGAYVANSTELLHFQDTNGDGRADLRRVLLSGFGTEDTHHILHTLRWGFDGMLYMNQSIYIHSHIETPYAVRRLGGGGIWQFRPETMQLEVFMRGLVNPWGHHFDRWGQSFATDGAGGEGINYVLPGAYYVTAPDAVRILAGLNPGSPKHCGAEIVSGRHLPEDWRGNIVTNDFRGNRVCRFVLSDDGAGFAAREQPELIKTRHVAFRPIDIKMGPDGALYIADWYNPIIQHGEVDFRDPRRDHTRGRIWRVTAKGQPPLERPRLVGASVETLLEALKAPEDWTRHHARRVLKERGAESVVPALVVWVKGLDPNDADVEHQRLEALWTYQALDEPEPDLLTTLLHAHDPRVRAAATRVVQHWQTRLPDPLGLLATQVADDNPRVRLEAVRVLAHIAGTRSAELALRALDRPVDKFLEYALWLTARELAPSWLPELQAGRFDAGGDARKLVFALEAVGSPEVVKPLRESLRAGKIPADQEERALTLIAALGAPGDLALILDMTLDDALPASRRAGLLGALAQATRQRKVRPDGDLTRLGRLFDAQDDALRAAAARAAGIWKVEPLQPRLIELARVDQTSDSVRHATISALAALGDAKSREALDQLAMAGSPTRVRMMAAVALASLHIKAGAARAAEILAAADPQKADPSDLFTGFLERKDGPAALAAALAGRTISADSAKIGLRIARASGRDEAALVKALTKAGSLETEIKALSLEQRDQILQNIVRVGDPARGEAVFRRKDAGCLKCHAIAGAGGRVGPDLVSIGASAPVDYLLDSILEPGKAIKENYHAITIATDDGRVLSGLKVRQNDAELVLLDADDREVSIPVRSIEEQKAAGSLMPAGLADALTRAELVDLVRFLSELGKVGSAYTVGQARVARRWQVAQLSADAGPHLRHGARDVAVNGDPRLRWEPAYSQVSGQLPLDAAPVIKLSDSGPSVGFARCELDVSTSGPVTLRLNSTAGLSVWLDAARLEVKETMTLELATGLHALTFALDLAARRDGLRCELLDAPGSPARVQWVSGK
jgi:putative heme-binding domain-containing protein